MGVFRVSLYGICGGQMTCNVIHFYKPDSVTEDAALLAEKFRDRWLVNPFQLNSDSNQSWNRIHVKQVDDDDPPIDLVVAYTGTWAANTNFTPVVCAVFQLKTATGGRKGRGRFYMSGFPLGAIQNGVWEPTTQARLTACANQLKSVWVTTPTESGFELVVAERTSPFDHIPVTNILARPMIGVQRRRNLGVGA